MSKYLFGREFEYKIKKSLERLGFFVIRASGSHGKIDLLAINDFVALAIQSKATKSTKKPSAKILKRIYDIELKSLKFPSNFVKILVYFYKNENSEGYNVVTYECND